MIKGENYFPFDKKKKVPVMSTLGWSVSEKDAEWKLASDVTCRGEKLMLRTATVRGWQPHAGVLSRACLATLLRVLMRGMLASGEKGKGLRTSQLRFYNRREK